MKTKFGYKILFTFLLTVIITITILVTVFYVQLKTIPDKYMLDNIFEEFLYSFLTFTVIFLIIVMIFGRFIIVKVNKPLEVLIDNTKNMKVTIADELQTNDEIETIAESIYNRSKQLEIILNSIPSSVILLDEDYRIIFSNKKNGCYYNNSNSCLDDFKILENKFCYEVFASNKEICKLCPVSQLNKEGSNSLENEIYFNNEIYKIKAIPIYSSNKKRIDYLVFSSNITVETLMNKAVIQNEKLATMGKLSAGITHELKNPISLVKTGIIYLKKLANKETLDFKEEVENVLPEIEDGIIRTEKVINNLLDFSRMSTVEAEWVYLKTIVNQVTLLFSKEFVEKLIKVNIDIEESLIIWFNSDSLKNILINLISNSLDAIGNNGGCITINGKYIESNTIKIEITDNGTGFDNVERERIFEPFYTSKTNSKNLGIGLWLVKNEVKKYSGKIIAYCNKDKKVTKFTLLLNGKKDTIHSERDRY